MNYEDEIAKIMEQCSNDVVELICNRINKIGQLSTTDAHRLANLSRTKDLKDINKMIADATNKSIAEIDNIIEQASKDNQKLAEQYYKYRNLDATVESAVLLSIKKQAKLRMKEDLLNLSRTTGFIIDGKGKTIKKAYTDAINRSIYATQQGLTDYNTAIRQTVKKLADSGLRVEIRNGVPVNMAKVHFSSGYSRNIYSQARMNVLDGVRNFNNNYHTQQGREFGADGVEVDAHGLCATDHINIQGRMYSNREFNALQKSLDRPISTCNCQHSYRPIILGISKPAYSEEELQYMKDYSNAPVEYTDLNGKKHTVSRYEASQRQRQVETNIRRLKDERNAFEKSGNELEVKRLNKKITYQSKYYRQLSNDVGLRPKQNRLQVPK